MRRGATVEENNTAAKSPSTDQISVAVSSSECSRKRRSDRGEAIVQTRTY